MEDTNVTVLVGRLTKDAELKLLEELQVGHFTIATDRKKKKPDGTHTEEASFFEVSTFGRYAEIMVPKLKKGTQVCVTGSLKQERWIDKKTQENRSRLIVTADAIQILGGKNNV